MKTSNRKFDINGWFEVEGNPISKVGVYQYSGKFIHPDLEPDTLYNVYRPAEELADPECIESFKLLPWGDNHPKALLGTDGYSVSAEEMGIEGVIGEKVFFDSDAGMLRGNIKCFSKRHADLIKDGKSELSAGYRCQYEQSEGTFSGTPYQFVQRKIRGNHLSSVDEGRMGPEVSVLDGMMFTIDNKEFKQMKKIFKIRKLLNDMLQYAADASENPETEEKEKGEIEQFNGLMKKVKPLVEELSDLPTIMAKTEMEEETEEDPSTDLLSKVVEDCAKDEDEDGDDDDDKGGTGEDEDEDKDDDDKGGEGAMDGKAVAKIVNDILDKRLPKPAPAMDAKEMMKEVAERDRLAKSLSSFIGVFDHSEMTVQEVAEYGVKKLSLPCEKGTERAVLSGYLHGRPTPAPATGFDSKTNDSWLDSQIGPKEDK